MFLTLDKGERKIPVKSRALKSSSYLCLARKARRKEGSKDRSDDASRIRVTIDHHHAVAIPGNELLIHLPLGFMVYPTLNPLNP